MLNVWMDKMPIGGDQLTQYESKHFLSYMRFVVAKFPKNHNILWNHEKLSSDSSGQLLFLYSTMSVHVLFVYCLLQPGLC